jgi:hypothetical protein
MLLIEELAQPKYHRRPWPEFVTDSKGERFQVREFLEATQPSRTTPTWWTSSAANGAL